VLLIIIWWSRIDWEMVSFHTPPSLIQKKLRRISQYMSMIHTVNFILLRARCTSIYSHAKWSSECITQKVCTRETEHIIKFLSRPYPSRSHWAFVAAQQHWSRVRKLESEYMRFVVRAALRRVRTPTPSGATLSLSQADIEDTCMGQFPMLRDDIA
jgi:hypothetical protein